MYKDFSTATSHLQKHLSNAIYCTMRLNDW